MSPQGAHLDPQAPAWFQQTYPQSAPDCVANFNMEFMLNEALRIHSGGLGNAAGDQRRVPMTWVFRSSTLRVGDVRLASGGGQRAFEAQVYLNDIEPEALRVERYANALGTAWPCTTR